MNYTITRMDKGPDGQEIEILVAYTDDQEQAIQIVEADRFLHNYKTDVQYNIKGDNHDC